MIQYAINVYLVLREVFVMKNVTQTVSMVCAVLMDPVRMDATMQGMGLDVEENVGITVFSVLMEIIVQNVYQDFMDYIVKEHAKTTVTTVQETLCVKAVKLVCMVGHVQSVALRNAKHVNLQTDVVLVRIACPVRYANVMKTVKRNRVERMGNV